MTPLDEAKARAARYAAQVTKSVPRPHDEWAFALAEAAYMAGALSEERQELLASK